MSATIDLYDDHRASAGWDGGGYPVIRLCEECAEEHGANVSPIDTFRARKKGTVEGAYVPGML